MFHHFHDEKIHLPSEGSISSKQFQLIINYLKKEFNILSVYEFVNKLLSNQLLGKDITLTFDDALRSQFDIAFPILKREKIKASFFIYSSAFSNNPNPLEFYRDYRNSYFKDTNSFYLDFFDECEKVYPDSFLKFTKNYSKDFLNNFPFYTENDKRFRFLRDSILDLFDYQNIMDNLLLRDGIIGN